MDLPTTALYSALALLGLWLFTFALWNDYRLDAFRDHVFSIRQELFFYAAIGSVAFNHPAYVMLRYRMNVILRYGDEFTLTKAILSAFIQPTTSAIESKELWEKALQSSLSNETSEALRGFSTALSVAVLQLMAYRSFLLYVLLRPFMPTVRIEDFVKRNPGVKSTVERIETEALLEESRKLSQSRDMIPAH
jgi:hypothetical protein